MVGQFGGETLGAMGGAAVPGGGETGLTEYGGAVAGGALGSGAGAAGENAIRKLYGLPPVSVGSEAAWGGAGSAAGGLIPLVPRFRKAAKLAQETGISFSEALQKIQTIEAGLAALDVADRVARHRYTSTRAVMNPARALPARTSSTPAPRTR